MRLTPSRTGQTADRGATRRFGLRMLVAVVSSLVMVGLVGNVLLTRQLRRDQITNYGAIQRADVRSFEMIGERTSTTKEAVREVDEVLDAIGRRPGAIDTLLIDRRGRIVASTNDAIVGQREDDPHVDEALRDRTFYAGHEVDEGEEARNFEFVSPLSLAGRPFALEISYDHRHFEHELAAIRRTLLLVGLLAVFGGGAIFYLVGGRALLRSHARSLERATRDGLTDLPNQRAFQDELPAAVASAARFQQHLSLAVFDIDDFKFLNDKHGHPHGDVVLNRVAAILRAGRAGDRPYRTGGDEFAVVMPNTDGEGALTLVRRLLRSLDAQEVKVSIGVSELRPGLSPTALRAEADAALYETKRSGGSGVTDFADIHDVVTLTTSDKRDAVRRLIEERRVGTVFQPIWDLSTDTLIGYEALSRPDPSYGLSGPAEAFDIAEQLGHVHELDRLCATQALRLAADLPGEERIFVNLSPMTLDLDASGNDWFRDAVEAANLPVERVVVEVTERFGGRTASVVKALTRMRAQGFHVALDDVGTGNSGLEMLRRVGAEYVKLDGSIVRAAATEPNARAVLLAMATFANQTGSFVIAEGIEDAETLAFLRHVHESGVIDGQLIRGGQGFGLGRPSPSSEFTTADKLVLADGRS